MIRSASLCFSIGPYDVIGNPIEVPSEGGSSDPAIMWMVIPGQAQWLKEFFDIQAVITNLAPSGYSLDDGTITLGSLASTNYYFVKTNGILTVKP